MLLPILGGWLTGFSIWFGGSRFSGVTWYGLLPWLSQANLTLNSCTLVVNYPVGHGKRYFVLCRSGVLLRRSWPVAGSISKRLVLVGLPKLGANYPADPPLRMELPLQHVPWM